MSDYTSALDHYPYHPGNRNATGLVPVLLRTYGHLVHALAQASRDEIDDANAELNEACSHANAFDFEAASLTDRATEQIRFFPTLITAAKDEFQTSNDKQIIIDTLHRCSAFAVTLDWELAGLVSDPGSVV